jgi:predicted AlkP superfamily phosphohydrolase/phosphomutase
MSARHLIVGFDGFDLAIVRQLGPAVLPNVHGVMARGAFSAQRSVLPPATLPNWTTFLTGVDPGRHGVFDFTTRHGYDVRFSGGSVREAPSVVSRLDALGLRCACLFFPATYPPERLSNGVFVSGWDAPVAFEADASFVWPPAMHASLVKRFGAQRFDDVDEFDADRPGWHTELPDALAARVSRKSALATWLLAGERWDAFAIYFGESDTAAHYLYGLHDPRSPRHPSDHPAARRVGPAGSHTCTWRSTARSASCWTAAGGQGGEAHQVELTIVSDHGSGGSSDSVLYLNRALAEAGLLTFHESPWVMDVAKRVKELALTKLPPALRERLFGLFGTALPSALESRARFGAIDFARTQSASATSSTTCRPCTSTWRGASPRAWCSPETSRACAPRSPRRCWPCATRSRARRWWLPCIGVKTCSKAPSFRARAGPAAGAAPRPWLQLQPHALGQRAARHGLLPAPGPR